MIRKINELTFILRPILPKHTQTSHSPLPGFSTNKHLVYLSVSVRIVLLPRIKEMFKVVCSQFFFVVSGREFEIFKNNCNVHVGDYHKRDQQIAERKTNPTKSQIQLFNCQHNFIFIMTEVRKLFTTCFKLLRTSEKV